MKALFQYMLRSMAAFFTTILTWIISFFAFDQTFLFSSLYALLGGTIIYFSLKQLGRLIYIQRSGLTRREYKFIEKNLKEAKHKISRLQKALMRIHSFAHAKQNLEIIRTVHKIYTNTKKEPKRFYQAERFYYKHLDSLVELTEKYAFLSSQPTKTKDMSESLQDTRYTITILANSIKKDLYNMLEDDIDTLHFELDVAKQSINRTKKDDRRVWK